MDILFKPISAQQIDSFYKKFQGKKTFLQTSQYGDFRKKLGEKNFRYGLFRDKVLVGTVQFQRVLARRGVHLHTPHGPLLEDETMLPFFLSLYKKIGKKEKCDFVRVSSLFSMNKKTVFQKEKFRDAAAHLINPERTWVLDITQSEEEILSLMRKSTRYEVRRSQKCDISVSMGNNLKDLDIFWNLHIDTVHRQKFIPFSKKVTQTELEIWGDDVQIFNSKIDQNYYSSSIIIFDSHAGYYHQGASVYNKFPVSHATLWSAIKEAKKRGCQEFNFWGVCEKDDKNHPWYGLSKFKRGFGGKEYTFLHAQDFPLTSKYWINWIIETYRKWKRNY
jgi:lipid II:glycine glycyltransferase (peptidoglycan interpeptide bridge formation enzyme)